MIGIVLCAVLCLAYVNGANDNFKGVATLYGSGTTSYRKALGWATVTTLCGSLLTLVLAAGMVKTFSAKGLVPDAIASSPSFLAAAALGGMATVLFATLVGLPVSTTHALTGALIGAGFVAASQAVNLRVLGKNFFLPLLISPLLSMTLCLVLYPLGRCLGRFFAIDRPILATAAPEEAATPSGLDVMHFLSAGAVSFARGLNDTPKIFALLLTAKAAGTLWGLGMVGTAMAVGGLLNARKVAETLSHKITRLNAGQGLVANLTTAILVLGASRLGLPVSTTHVATGGLFGIGVVTGTARARTILTILLAWVTTLPLGAALGALAYLALRG